MNNWKRKFFANRNGSIFWNQNDAFSLKLVRAVLVIVKQRHAAAVDPKMTTVSSSTAASTTRTFSEWSPRWVLVEFMLHETWCTKPESTTLLILSGIGVKLIMQWAIYHPGSCVCAVPSDSWYRCRMEGKGPQAHQSNAFDGCTMFYVWQTYVRPDLTGFRRRVWLSAASLNSEVQYEFLRIPLLTGNNATVALPNHLLPMIYFNAMWSSNTVQARVSKEIREKMSLKVPSQELNHKHLGLAVLDTMDTSIPLPIHSKSGRVDYSGYRSYWQRLWRTPSLTQIMVELSGLVSLSRLTTLT
ncbi:hypothetical protein K474DRAFT_1696156 [Panus rudis PR-1116 ss-1]|nr:hypothetical protein K474DRAFT_1696156 [Panus rudis PR-1116 ss-1]